MQLLCSEHTIIHTILFRCCLDMQLHLHNHADDDFLHQCGVQHVHMLAGPPESPRNKMGLGAACSNAHVSQQPMAAARRDRDPLIKLLARL